MSDINVRDYVTVENEEGEQQYAIEALFDMEDRTYALLQAQADEEELLLMRVEGDEEDQYLVGIDDPDELESVLDAYQIAVEAAPADRSHMET